MYETFYGLKQKPFTLLPDPEFILPTHQHRTAMMMLEYALFNGAPFCVITGEIGTGKSVLVRNLLDRLENGITAGLITNTQASIGELLQWVLMAFNLDYVGKAKVELYQVLVNFIKSEYANNRRTVLIVDEAQNLGGQILEELRMLSNINAGKDQLLQMILVGQHQLRELLRQPQLEQFAQRIVVNYHLEPLTEEETETYIYHRLGVAGAENCRLFTEEACKSIYSYSGGVPRLINMLCDLALVYGYAEEASRIGVEIVHSVARDRLKHGIAPLKKKS